jgi:hypothetical protein
VVAVAGQKRLRGGSERRRSRDVIGSVVEETLLVNDSYATSIWTWLEARI